MIGVLAPRVPSASRDGKYWMPAECDVPLRPGWIYHPAEDGQTKSAYDLLGLYYKSVGRGACLDIGLSPNKSGVITQEDLNSLRGFKSLIQKTFSDNMAKGATLTASNVRGNNTRKYGTKFLIDNDRYTYWATDDAVTKPELVIDLHTPKTFNVVRIRENIKLGQRILAAAVDAYEKEGWKEIATVSSIGANRLIRLPKNVTSSKLRLRITASPVSIAISDFGIFKEPVHLTVPYVERDKEGYVSIKTEAPVSSIHYTVDGSMPTVTSALYETPFLFKDAGTIKALCFDGRQKSTVRSHVFGYSKRDWKISVNDGHTDKSIDAIIDENPATISHIGEGNTINVNDKPVITIDMGKTNLISAFTYLPRQDKSLDGVIDSYAYFISGDGIEWREVSEGEFSNISSNPIEQVIKVKEPVNARYIRFGAKHVIKGNGCSIAELGVK